MMASACAGLSSETAKVEISSMGKRLMTLVPASSVACSRLDRLPIDMARAAAAVSA